MIYTQHSFHLTREFFTHLKTSPLLMNSSKFDVYSGLVTIEQWGFFKVPHLCDTGLPLLWSSRHTCCRAFDRETVNTSFNDLSLSHLGFIHPTLACQPNALTHCTTAGIEIKTVLSSCGKIGPETWLTSISPSSTLQKVYRRHDMK